jgi:hypothetical protein
MATRSFICKSLPDHSIRGIYCHFDGDMTGVGQTLEDHYTTEAQVDALLALGDISELGVNVDTTVAYHRVRGEDFNSNMTYSSLVEMEANVGTDLGAQYAYVWMVDCWEAISL